MDTAFRIPEGLEGQRIAAFSLDGTPPKVAFLGGDLVVQSGAARGKRLPLARVVDKVVVLGIVDASVASQLKAGDEVIVDDSNFLAMEAYHRHQVRDASYKVWDASVLSKVIGDHAPVDLGPARDRRHVSTGLCPDIFGSSL